MLKRFNFLFFHNYWNLNLGPTEDNTNWRPGGLEGRVSKWTTWIFGRLHRRQKGVSTDCGKGRSDLP